MLPFFELVMVLKPQPIAVPAPYAYRCCQAGKDVADELMATPGMLGAVKTVLDASPPPAPTAEGALMEGAGSLTHGML